MNKDINAGLAASSTPFSLMYFGVPGHYSESDLINYQSNRKWMVTEIFLVYLVFLVLKVRQGPSEPDTKDAGKQVRQRQFKQQHSRFMIFLSQHVLLQSFAIMYGPRDFAVVAIYLHFLAFLMIVAGYKKMNEKLVNIGYAICCVLNILNLLIGMGHLGSIRQDAIKNLTALQ